MEEKYIEILYRHNVKGLLGRCEAEEIALFYLKGFSKETILEEPERFQKSIEKVLADMKKNYSFCMSLDIKDAGGNLIYRINPKTETTEKGWTVYFELLTFKPNMFNFSDLHRAEKKEIMDTLKSFFNDQFLSAYAA